MDPYFMIQKQFIESVDLNSYNPEYIAKITGLPLQQVSDFISPQRRYMVQSENHYGFLAGANGNGRPTILFCRMDFSINVVSFEDNWEFNCYEIQFSEGTDWKEIEEEIGFMHMGNAPMRFFKHPEIWDCAILPFPMGMHYNAIGESQEKDDFILLKKWIEDESYTLYWGNDYFLDVEGYVTSS
ncbi:hypothetical protein [Candidatus Uabimicrobium sp. HlEnr_7]|uniref:hypothetical protein n=1 Tax=Candidatus Uabimicrobium helgolandensis TaxID=3095367 RepID=UPI003556545D